MDADYEKRSVLAANGTSKSRWSGVETLENMPVAGALRREEQSAVAKAVEVLSSDEAERREEKPRSQKFRSKVRHLLHILQSFNIPPCVQRTRIRQHRANEPQS